MFREGTVTRSETRSHEQGFSMVELVIAMTVTLIISGAVFQLMTASQDAFRKEPGVADRQQSIRMALDIISQDIFRAGLKLPTFAQSFTDGLDGAGPTGSNGAATDEIEICAGTDCSSLMVCDVNGSNVSTLEPLAGCFNLPRLVVIANVTEWQPYWAEDSGTGTCPGSTGASASGRVVFANGVSSHNTAAPGAVFTNPPEWMVVGDLVRYRMNPGPDGVPQLERSIFGGEDWPDGTSSWEVIAPGVEDLQLEYMNGSGNWQDSPGAVTCGAACGAPGQAEFDTLVRRVRIRITARALINNVAGQTTDALGVDAIRGQLVTEVAPRAAVIALGQGAGEL